MESCLFLIFSPKCPHHNGQEIIRHHFLLALHVDGETRRRHASTQPHNRPGFRRCGADHWSPSRDRAAGPPHLDRRANPGWSRKTPERQGALLHRRACRKRRPASPAHGRGKRAPPVNWANLAVDPEHPRRATQRSERPLSRTPSSSG